MSGGGHVGDVPGALIRAVLPGPCGVPWLLLPGWQQSAAHWAPVARWLSGSGVTLLSADLAGAAARCAAPPGTVARSGELVDRLLGEPAAAEAVMVVGHSAGAPLAVLVAAALPGVRGVVLAEPVASHFGAAPPRHAAVPGGHGAGPGGLRERYPMAAEATLRTIEAAARGLPPGEPARRTRIPTDADGERAARAGRALAGARAPVLVVRGRASALLSAGDAEALAAMAPRGWSATVPDAGHSPHIDRPRATAAQLTAFAAEVADHPPTYAGAARE
ncbi:alpha/beta fold hydrolase [Streptomyces sp. RTd22]|uniref:alpha/beta fold hydrolase n=1 Tax=Streptomyces sp. RTd22 TaxID=1841249 RepID=UPI0007C591E2|nr:alpha/beta hydrolase [Streptomyces sp. RTd22]